MKWDIVDRTKSSAIDLCDNSSKVIWRELDDELWRELDDELAVEIVWEAFDLIGLYILLRTMYHVLLVLEYASLKVRTSHLNLIEQKLIQNENDLLEERKALIWQIFNKYQISGTGINVHRQLRTESKKDKGLYENFVIESDSTLIHPMVPYITETLTSSYCC
jgi:hypothetical protein